MTEKKRKTDKMVRVYVDIPASLRDALKREAVDRGVFFNRLIREKLEGISKI